MDWTGPFCGKTRVKVYKCLTPFVWLDFTIKKNNNATDVRLYNSLKCPRKMTSEGRKVNFFLIPIKAPPPQTSYKHKTRWGCDVVMVSCELKCITSSCCIMVKYRSDGLQVVFVFVCVWSSRFPLHPSLWQRRTNQSPPCLFSFHHTRPTSSFISRLAFMKTHGGRIILRWDGLTEVYTVPMWPETIFSVRVCVWEYFLKVFTQGEETLVKVMMLGEYCRLF